MLTIVLIILLVLLVIGAAPTWPHSRTWGPYPAGILVLLLVVIVVLVLVGRLPITY